MRRTRQHASRAAGRGTAAWVSFAVLALALLWLAMMQGGSAVLAAAVVLVGASLVVILRLTLVQAGFLLSVVFAFTTTWNAVGFGLVRPADLALVGGLGCFVAAGVGQPGRWPRVPPWILGLALMIVVVAALNAVIPFDPGYLNDRVFLNSQGVPGQPGQSNFGIVIKWLPGLIGVPVLIGFARRWREDALAWISSAFALGGAVSGFVATSDRLGVTHIGPRLLGVVYGTRQTGLSLHPNHLSETCTLAAPFACWMIATLHGRWRVLGVIALAGNMAGAYYSGSRAGAVVVVVAVLASFLLLQSLRRQLVQLTAAVAIVGVGVLIRFPGLLDTVQSTTRLNSDTSTDSSDQARAALSQQSLEDFRHSPIYGNGLQIALSSHDIFRQTLAAGGIMLFGAFVVYGFFVVRGGVLLSRVDQLGVAATISTGAWILAGTVENFVTDRYLFVSVGVIIAGRSAQTAQAARAARAARAADSDTAVPAVDPEPPRRRPAALATG